MLLQDKLKEYGIFDETTYKYIHINGYKTTYICDIYGNIYNTKQKKKCNNISLNKLTPIKLPNGYFVVTLSINGETTRDYIHRLIAKEFIKIPNKYLELNYTFDNLEVNHKNGDKSDNSIYNLEWVTDSDNKIHGYKMNLYKHGEENSKSIYSNKQVHHVCRLIEENKLKPSEISEITGVSVAQILDIRNHGSWLEISNLYDFSNYTPKQCKYSDKQLSDMWNMISKNIPPTEISNITGINIKTIYEYRRKSQNVQRLSKA